MKIDTENKYVKISLCAFAVVAASIILWWCIAHMSRISEILSSVISVTKPFIYGFVIAYVFNYPYKKFIALLELIKVKHPLKQGAKVAISIILTYVLLLSILSILMYLVVPVVVNALLELLELTPSYLEYMRTAIGKWLASYLMKFDISAHTITQIMDGIIKELSAVVDVTAFIKNATAFIISMSVEIKNFALGIIISIYLLVDKHRFILTGKKLLYLASGQTKGDRILEVLSFTDKTFGGYIIAKVVDSAIIGFICYIGMSLLKLDYAVLISVIVGITNVIPFFGPFIGAIPSILLLLAINPWQALIFAVFILILQQFDGNVLGPKLLGESTGIRAIYVVFAVIVGGGLFGIIGMFISVPLFAVLYTLCSEFINEKISQKNIKVD